MTILIDFRPNNRSGIYRYGIEVISRLLNHMRSEVIIFCPKYIKKNLLKKVASQIGKKQIFIDSGNFSLMRNSSKIKDAIKYRKIRLVYSVNYLIEPDLEVPFIFTVHDVLRIKNATFCYSNEEITNKYSSLELKIMREELDKTGLQYSKDNIFFSWLKLRTKLLADKSEAIITVSKTSKTDICRILGVSPSKVVVSYCGVDKAFVRKNFYLKEANPYFLYVGLAKNHKRLDWIIKRWNNIFPKLPENFKLRIVGSSLELERDIKPLVKRFNLQETIIFDGYVKDSRLIELYNGAIAILIASLDEGFCLPAAEAIACGCSVIATDIPILREILGDNAVLIKADEENHYEQAIINAAFQEKCAKKTYITPYYNWEEVAYIVHNTISSILAKDTGN